MIKCKDQHYMIWVRVNDKEGYYACEDCGQVVTDKFIHLNKKLEENEEND